MKRVAIGSDHAGFALKCHLLKELQARNIDVIDLGTDSEEPIDYPPFCFAVAEAVSAGDAEWGIVLGGSGQGEQIAANKVNGVRAALCDNVYYAKLARRDNDANVLALGARVVAPELAVEIVDMWLNTNFDGGRHMRRINLISEYERKR